MHLIFVPKKISVDFQEIAHVLIMSLTMVFQAKVGTYRLQVLFLNSTLMIGVELWRDSMLDKFLSFLDISVRRCLTAFSITSAKIVFFEEIFQQYQRAP